jgi:hypothetical protein
MGVEGAREWISWMWRLGAIEYLHVNWNGMDKFIEPTLGSGHWNDIVLNCDF